MALTSTTFVLVPNQYDGRQRLSDPLGTLAPASPGLQPVTALTISNTTENTQALTWQHDESDGVEGYQVDIWIANQDTEWRYLDYRLVGTKTYTASGLPSDRYIRYRVAAWIEGPPIQYSAWAEVDGSTSVNPGSGGTTDLTQLSYFNNFEHHNHTTGLNLYGADRFSANRNMSLDTRKAYGGGSQCANTYLSEGTNGEPYTEEGYSGWGYWGWNMVNYFPHVQSGGEIWFRQAIFWPAGASANTSRQTLKQFRMHKSTSGGAHLDYLNFQLNYTTWKFELILEGVDHPFTDQWGNPTARLPMPEGPAWPRGEWVMLETYFKLSSATGGGIAACWVNDVPAGRENVRTLTNSSDVMDRVSWATHWNEGIDEAGGFQEQWLDQIAVAIQGPTSAGVRNDAQYLSTDEDGYKFIGSTVNNTPGAGNH
jgi:hypothetical protein